MTKRQDADDGVGDDAGQAEVQRLADEAAEQGFIGSSPDATPNEAYTLKGVTSGQPTPETERGKG